MYKISHISIILCFLTACQSQPAVRREPILVDEMVMTSPQPWSQLQLDALLTDEIRDTWNVGTSCSPPVEESEALDFPRQIITSIRENLKNELSLDPNLYLIFISDCEVSGAPYKALLAPRYMAESQIFIDGFWYPAANVGLNFYEYELAGDGIILKSQQLYQ